MTIILTGHGLRKAMQAMAPITNNGPDKKSKRPPNMRIFILRRLFNKNTII